jgi:hypothetical protein
MTISILDIIHRTVFYLKHDVSETAFCLRIQVEPTQLGQASPPEDGNILQYPKRRVLNKRQDDGYCDSYLNIPLSETYR